MNLDSVFGADVGAVLRAAGLDNNESNRAALSSLSARFPGGIAGGPRGQSAGLDVIDVPGLLQAAQTRAILGGEGRFSVSADTLDAMPTMLYALGANSYSSAGAYTFTNSGIPQGNYGLMLSPSNTTAILTFDVVTVDGSQLTIGADELPGKQFADNNGYAPSAFWIGRVQTALSVTISASAAVDVRLYARLIPEPQVQLLRHQFAQLTR